MTPVETTNVVVQAPAVKSETVKPEPITKVSIVISKGSLDGIYPGLIMANGARAEGIEVDVFFTFFGLDAIHRKRQENIKIATVLAAFPFCNKTSAGALRFHLDLGLHGPAVYGAQQFSQTRGWG